MASTRLILGVDATFVHVRIEVFVHVRIGLKFRKNGDDGRGDSTYVCFSAAWQQPGGVLSPLREEVLSSHGSLAISSKGSEFGK